MAKRAAPNEEPYRPLLDTSLVTATLSQAAATIATTTSAAAQPPGLFAVPGRAAEAAPRIDPPRRIEQIRPPAESVVREADPPRPAPQQLFEKFDQEKRILFTRGETQAIDRLVTSLAGRLNAQVKVSHVIRALVGLLLNAEGEVDRRAGESGPLVRPPNGDPQALQKFEREIGRIIAAALRDAGPPR